ncbi:MAG: LamG-like jellyroll fold domain-containing protein [Thermoguttaceae bacterium]
MFLRRFFCFVAVYCLTTGMLLSEIVTVTESFETEPIPGMKLIDGVKGKAGLFDGESSLVLKTHGQCSSCAVEFYISGDAVEHSGSDLKDWQPLVHAGSSGWNIGAFQIIFRNGKCSVHFHNGGTNRLALDTPPLQNGKWYHIKFVADAKAHFAALFLDDKEVGRVSISPEIKSFDIDSPSIGAGNNTFLRGKMDELSLILDIVPEHVSDDPRNITKGSVLPCEMYCDQPYIVVLKDGTWVCMMTTGAGLEGMKGQHVVATRSTDQGKTWSELIDIEPASEVSASWIVPLLTPFGRIYGFYTYNGDGVKLGRDDTHGWYAYRYSDDGGLTWSERHRIPLRTTACDELEKDGKLVQMFWGICKPRIEGDDVFIAFTKLGKYFLENGEGWIFHSDNIMSEKDVTKINWELLPDGEHGIRNPEYGSVQEEHIIVPLDAKDKFMCVYRGTNGFPNISWSTDRCRTWSLPEPMEYANGRMVHTPRACPQMWKVGPSRYLFWFHNNAGKWFDNRNPAWLSAGIERDGKIYWSQPEIGIYSDTPKLRMSYPDLVVLGDNYWISETQKEIARVHEIDSSLLRGMYEQLERSLDQKPGNITQNGKIHETTRSAQTIIPLPASFAKAVVGKGFTFDFDVIVPENGLTSGTVLLDNRSENGGGFCIMAEEDGSIRFLVQDSSNDDDARIDWMFDRGLLTPGSHRISIIVESAPRIVMAIVDGQFVDGNGEREFGWGRFDTMPAAIVGTGNVVVSPAVGTLRIYDRPLRIFEVLSNQASETRANGIEWHW